MIHTEKLRRRFGDTLAVADLDLDVAEGELFAFLGPNGAGKTTTIKMLTGLLRPTAGRAVVAGFDVVEEPLRAKASTGYIPDHPFLYERLTVQETMAFVAGLYDLDRGSPKGNGTSPWQSRAEELLHTFEIHAVKDRLVSELSHGMRQKLSFATTFLHEPKVVVVDEPWVGLDPKNLRRVKDFLRQRADEGTTVFMSTHSLAIAEEMADRVGILHRGRLLHTGTVEELKGLEERAEAGEASSTLESVFLQLTRDEADGP